MSNPGVIDLSSGEIAGRIFKIEDNIGECIHIHFGEMRIDLTIKEFDCLCNRIYYALENLITVEGFFLRDIPQDFLIEIAGSLTKLRQVKTEKVKLENLMTILEENVYKKCSIKESSRLRTLKCNDDEMKRDIILFNNQNFIRSGIARAEKLYRDMGNIDVEVKRFYFLNNVLNIDYEAFEKQIEMMNTYKHIIKETLESIPDDYKIAIRGAGEHTEKILELMPEGKQVECILERKADRNYGFKGYKIVSMKDIDKMDIDVIIISSFKYHYDINKELRELYRRGEVRIIDFYKIFEEKGIKAEKAFYMAELGEKIICI